MTDRIRFDQAFDEFHDVAFRLETLREYGVGDEPKHVARFADGGYLPKEPFPGVSFVRDMVEPGRRTSLVRLVSDPPTIPERYSLEWVYPHHAAAGREISILRRTSELASEAAATGDYWLFDSTTVVLMRYDETGDIKRREILTDPRQVAYYVEFRDRLLAAAEPFRQWLAGWRQRVR